MFGNSIDKCERVFYTCSCQMNTKRKSLQLHRCWHTSTVDFFNTYTQIHKRYEFEEQKRSLAFYIIYFY